LAEYYRRVDESIKRFSVANENAGIVPTVAHLYFIRRTIDNKSLAETEFSANRNLDIRKPQKAVYF